MDKISTKQFYLFYVFWGFLWLDKFYRKKYILWLLKLFTFWGYGIWWIVDIFLAMDKLEDIKTALKPLKIIGIIFWCFVILWIISNIVNPIKEITFLETKPNIENWITTEKNITLIGGTENVEKLKINDTTVDIKDNSFSYTLELEEGKNNIIFSSEWKILQKYEIEKITKEEFEKRKQAEEQKKIYEERKKQEKEEKKKLEKEQKRIEEEKRKQEELRKAKERKTDELIKKQFSPRDGNHMKLTLYLKDNYLKDPDSYQHIQTLYHTYWNEKEWYYLKVVTKYRAKNSFGWYVIWYATAYFDIEWNPIKTDSWEMK